MPDLRLILAALLGMILGLILLAFPATLIRIQTVGRLPDDRSSKYGKAATPSDTWRRIVQGIGGLLVLAGLYFAASVFGYFN